MPRRAGFAAPPLRRSCWSCRTGEAAQRIQTRMPHLHARRRAALMSVSIAAAMRGICMRLSALRCADEARSSGRLNRLPPPPRLPAIANRRVYKHSRRLYSEADAQGLRVYHDERLDGSDGERAR